MSGRGGPLGNPGGHFLSRGPLRRVGLHDQDLWRGGNALKILDERLARGEIDIEEYNQRREAIKQHQKE